MVITFFDQVGLVYILVHENSKAAYNSEYPALRFKPIPERATLDSRVSNQERIRYFTY